MRFSSTHSFTQRTCYSVCEPPIFERWDTQRKSWRANKGAKLQTNRRNPSPFSCPITRNHRFIEKTCYLSVCMCRRYMRNKTLTTPQTLSASTKSLTKNCSNVTFIVRVYILFPVLHQTPCSTPYVLWLPRISTTTSKLKCSWLVLFLDLKMSLIGFMLAKKLDTVN